MLPPLQPPPATQRQTPCLASPPLVYAQCSGRGTSIPTAEDNRTVELTACPPASVPRRHLNPVTGRTTIR